MAAAGAEGGTRRPTPLWLESRPARARCCGRSGAGTAAAGEQADVAMAGAEAGTATVGEEAGARRPVAGRGMKKFEWEGGGGRVDLLKWGGKKLRFQIFLGV